MHVANGFMYSPIPWGSKASEDLRTDLVMLAYKSAVTRMKSLDKQERRNAVRNDW